MSRLYRPSASIYDRGTWIDPEEVCTDIGQFRRKAVVLHSQTGKKVTCQAAIPDTFFSIPATTRSEHGYITSTGNDQERWLEFRPHTDQTQTPAQYRKDYRKRCK